MLEALSSLRDLILKNKLENDQGRDPVSVSGFYTYVNTGTCAFPCTHTNVNTHRKFLIPLSQVLISSLPSANDLIFVCFRGHRHLYHLYLQPRPRPLISGHTHTEKDNSLICLFALNLGQKSANYDLVFKPGPLIARH